jgi:hypothetical protein
MDLIRIILSVLIPPLGNFFQGRFRQAFLAEHHPDVARLYPRSGPRNLDH